MAEKRALAPLPKLSLENSAQFPSEFEAYYNDHFGFREELLHFYNYYQFALLNTSTSKRVIVGQDGWLFQNGQPHVSDMRNTWPFSPGELQHWANVLAAKHAWCKQQGIEYLFVITPSKHLIYPEKLPSAFQPANPDSRADQLISYLKEHTGVPVVDMRNALRKEKKKIRPYYKTDTHWNDYGAYIGYREVMNQLKKVVRGVKPLRLKRRHFKMVDRPGGDLAQSLNLHQQIIESTPVLDERPLNCINNSTIQGKQDNAARNKQWFSTTCQQGSHRVLMFRDSYSLAMMPYLSETFAYIHYIPHSPVAIPNMQGIVQQQKPDIVIEQRTTRWLRTPEG